MNGPDFWGRAPEAQKVQVQLATDMGFEVAYFVMGNEDDENAPVAVALKIGPNGVVFRHCHDCERFEVVVRGTLLVGDRVLGPGDVMTARAGELYGPHTAGPEGCVTYEVFSTLRGLSHIVYETADGLQKVDLTRVAAAPKSMLEAQNT